MSWQSRIYYWRFNRPRQYQIKYAVTLPTAIRAGQLILPCPLTTNYQTVSNLTFTTDGIATPQEHYISYQNCSKAEINCQVVVFPRRVVLPEQMTIAECSQPADYYIHSEHSAIQALVKKFTQGKNIIKISKQLYDYTVTHLQYGNPIPGLYTTTDVLQNNCVDCGGFATFLAALLRAGRIPARLIAGFWAGQKHNDMHAWLEYLLPNGQWVALDPSVDHLLRQHRTNKVAGYNFVGSDRIVLSLGSDHQLNINGKDTHVGLLQTPLLVHFDGTFTYVSTYNFTTL